METGYRVIMITTLCMIWNGRCQGCSSNFGRAKFGVTVVEDDTTKLTISLFEIDGDLDTSKQKKKIQILVVSE